MLKYLIEKEFKQFIRNSFMPRIVIIMPIMMILIFPLAANMDIKDVKLSIVDKDHSTYSERLTNKLISSGYFKLTNVSNSNNEALASIEVNESDIILEIEQNFEKNLIREGIANVMISANAVNSSRGGIGSSYIAGILNDFSDEIRGELIQSNTTIQTIPQISLNPQYRFNPHLEYKVFMIPAIMVILLTLLTGFIPALNIVSEKEIGTIEQMNVTPINKNTFILSKLIPYWIIGFVVLTICFILAALVYNLKPVGSLLTIYLMASIYISVVSGLGLVVSNYSNTIQQAMFVMFFFIMILILLSGLFTPIESMPKWAQLISDINPLKYFIQVMRMVYLKGSSFWDLKTQAITLLCFSLTFNTWAVISYKKKN